MNFQVLCLHTAPNVSFCKWNAEIAIGTAEIFQGQEKDVIIISTVRTNGEIGFVKDERVCIEAIIVIC